MPIPHISDLEDLRFCIVSYFWVLRLPSSSPFCLGISHKAIHGTSISPAFLQDFCDHSHQTKHSSAPQRLATLETPSTAQLHEEKVNGSRFSEGDPSFHQDVISCCWNGEGYPEPCIERADSKAFNLLGSQLNWVQLKPPCITLTITKLQKKGFAAFCVSAVKISRVFVSLRAHPALADVTFHKERTENGPGFQCKNSTRSAIMCRKSV